jgi:hypothetical protein
MTTDIKPSEVDLTVPHFVACAGRAEREFALGLYVRACQARGDAWQSLTPRDTGEVLRADRLAKRDPYWFPDFPDLVEAGYARWLGEGKGAPLELTDLGFRAIEKWVAMVGRAKEARP